MIAADDADDDAPDDPPDPDELRDAVLVLIAALNHDPSTVESITVTAGQVDVVAWTDLTTYSGGARGQMVRYRYAFTLPLVD